MTRKREILKRLEKDYYNPKSYLFLAMHKDLYAKYKKLGLTLGDIQTFLQGQPIHVNFSKPVINRLHRNPTYIYRIRDLLCADLIDLSKTPHKGHKYILSIIDAWSKFSWNYAQRTKTAQETLNNFQKWYNTVPYRLNIKRMIFDAGKEFTKVVSFLQSKNITVFVPDSFDGHVSFIEAYLKSYKKHLMRRAIATGTILNWKDYVQVTTDYMNNKVHGVTLVKPIHAEMYPSRYAWKIRKSFETKYLNALLYKIKQSLNDKKKNNQLRINDFVQIRKSFAPFENRFFKETSTDEIFQISKIQERLPIRLYILQDTNNETIAGSFYKFELLKIDLDNYHAVDYVYIEPKIKKPKTKFVFVKLKHKNRKHSHLYLKMSFPYFKKRFQS